MKVVLTHNIESESAAHNKESASNVFYKCTGSVAYNIESDVEKLCCNMESESDLHLWKRETASC